MAAPSRFRKNFGRRVRSLRQARGLSLEALGERAGVNDKFLQAVETARQAPTLDVVEKLAKGLGVRASELFAEELPAATRDRVAKLIDQLSDEDLRRAALVLEAIVRR